MHPVVFAVAITGPVPRKKGDPAMLLAVREPIASFHEAHDAGTMLAPLHDPYMRNPDKHSPSLPACFAGASAIPA